MNFLKPEDFVSPSCPYAPTLAAMKVDEGEPGAIETILTDFTNAEPCRYVLDGKCQLATYALAQMMHQATKQ